MSTVVLVHIKGMSMEDFKRCTASLFDGDQLDISCKLGLWSVCGEDKDAVQDEALHYFRQYKSDGEYSSILGGESVTEKLIKKIT